MSKDYWNSYAKVLSSWLAIEGSLFSRERRMFLNTITHPENA